MVHHRRGLRRLLRNDELVAAVEHDWTTAALSPKRTAMLRYAVKLTETRAATTDAVREAGFSDRDILDITEVVGYYAYANRIADGLGLQTEDWIPD